MKLRKHLLSVALTAGLIMIMTSCGGSNEDKTASATVTETTVQETTRKAEEMTGKADEGNKETETSVESGDVGRYVIYEYEAGGHSVTHDMLVESGMGNTYIELYSDGTGKFNLFDSLLDITWKPGEITVYGTSVYTYEIKDDKLYLDMQGTAHYTMVKEDGDFDSGSGANKSEEKKEAGNADDKETDEDSTDKADSDSGTKTDAPSGDGIITEEQLQKGYVWMNRVAKDIFNTTYEELAEYFGVDGEFDKEEYSDHMKRNKRYYKWISSDDSTHFVYVNFDEKDAEKEPGVYKISSFNSSGFSSSEAESKYLEEVKAEASDNDKAAAANAKMKDFAVDIHPFGNDNDGVNISMQIPESGWSYDESRDKVVENEDADAFGAGFIQFKLKDNVEGFDFYKKDFENYKDIDDREFDGVVFHGRTYKSIGYEWTEYIAQLDDTHALSIGIVRIDLSDGTMGDKILKSLKFKI
ncbi:hypothetical protein [Oribacterium sp. WCC10]|uniref:hypothetical protein n=1 Tax=Oribacterium sp. WCC10 TaxID=1855343 RepID=UPI0008E74B3B|nr:hypothetical protein [Oribacterium sp. WCC10]SFG44333.1 hypothetical protein SAMN05216356_1092 [Oribacterium sp. WCC10]